MDYNSKLDTALHQLHNNVTKRGILWHDYKDWRYKWYYAENGLYLIIGTLFGELYLVEARDATTALEHVYKKIGKR